MSIYDILEALLLFFFPPHCPACRRYQKARGAWCENCLKEANAVRRLRLTLEERDALTEAWALGRYEGALQNLIRRLKYQGRKETLPYIETFLRSVEDEFFRKCLPIKNLIATPVPLHPAKERKRGFNQTELLFLPWLAAHGIPLRRLLLRTRATKPQYGLSKDARKENMKGAFAVPDDAKCDVRGKDLLLLDDIFTTGVTCAECARALKSAGARRVIALALTSGQK